MGSLPTSLDHCVIHVSDWERARVDICARLDALASLARSAGEVYIDTELAAQSRFRSQP